MPRSAPGLASYRPRKIKDKTRRFKDAVFHEKPCASLIKAGLTVPCFDAQSWKRAQLLRFCYHCFGRRSTKSTDVRFPSRTPVLHLCVETLLQGGGRK